MHIVPALHGGQISGLKPHAAAYIRYTAQGQLNSGAGSTVVAQGADLRSRST